MEARPFIYLDQWAYSEFSKRGLLRERLLKVLSQGTLLISWLNLLEFSRAKGATAENTADFLDAVGGRWAAVALGTRVVAQRLREFRIDPWRDELYLPPLLRAPRVAGKLGALARRFQEPWVIGDLEKWEKETEDIANHLASARERNRRGDLKLDGFWDLPDEVDARAVFETVTQRLARSDLRLDRNQIDDYLHTCVPVSHADVVFLDRKTKQLLEGLKTRARVFYAGEVEEALTYLERDMVASR